MTKFVDTYGSSYSITETTFLNPVTGAETVLFVMVNESGCVLNVSTHTWAPGDWVRDLELVGA